MYYQPSSMTILINGSSGISTTLGSTSINTITSSFTNYIHSGWVNGTQFVTNRQDLETINLILTQNIGLLGCYFGTGSGVYPAYGNLYELIQFNTSLSNSDRQSVEGYLAFKYGTQSNLPIQHPYSLFRIKFSPSDRKSTRLNSSHIPLSRMPSSA